MKHELDASDAGGGVDPLVTGLSSVNQTASFLVLQVF